MRPCAPVERAVRPSVPSRLSHCVLCTLGTPRLAQSLGLLGMEVRANDSANPWILTGQHDRASNPHWLNYLVLSFVVGGGVGGGDGGGGGGI